MVKQKTAKTALEETSVYHHTDLLGLTMQSFSYTTESKTSYCVCRVLRTKTSELFEPQGMYCYPKIISSGQNDAITVLGWSQFYRPCW